MSDLSERLSTALADRYAIQREIGRGGMATVLLAQDLKHQRPVALKVIHPELAAGLAAERFLREIRIAANLQHPHIVPLHDSGEADGLLYYVMPYVEGESLRARLKREGTLPLDEALHIAGAVADALEHAHRSDVVHRDIKPENILLSGGHALVTDFGIATATSAVSPDTLTQTGIAIGTPTYMSPEQAESAKSIDGRTDIYSLGCVLYEMLAGKPPYEGPTAMAIFAQQALEKMTPLTTVRSDTPVGVERVVQRALANTTADRFASAADFAEALVTAPSVVAAAVAPDAASTKGSIAVMPFANMSAGPDNEYFCDGMSEEIINALTHVASLNVAARSSSFAFKGKEMNARAVGDELNVSTILEGSVRKAGDNLRITAQLINVEDGFQLWSQRFDRDMEDVFAVQDEIAQAIVDALKLELAAEEEADLLKRGTNDVDAYHLCLKGRHFWNQRAVPKAIECFKGAIAKDPDYASAHAGLADALTMLGYFGFMPSDQAYALATAAARRAVALDDGLADAHCSLALTELYFGWDLQAAENELRRAITLNPRLALAHAYLCGLLGAFGRTDEFDAEARRAQELEPLSPLVHSFVGFAHFLLRQYDQAIDASAKALELDSRFITALAAQGLAYSQQGRWDDAIAAAETTVASTNRSPLMLTWLGGVYAQSGRHDDARRVLKEFHERSAAGHVPSASFAWIHFHLDEADEAFEWLERAFQERNPLALFINGWPGLERAGSDPRYSRLLKDAGLDYLAEV
jgi:serine/threonine-protein kinase